MTISRKYDLALKNIFSHPEMIEDIIKTFVNEEWVKSLDFASLETEKTEYVTRELSARRADSIWKIRSNDEWVYLLFLLEFQSSDDTYMANRILMYGSLAYQELIKSKKIGISNHKLPPIFPLVFYTGVRPWQAPTEFRECLSGSIPDALMKYQFNAKYAVIDIGHLPLEKYHFSDDNLVLPLINLERAKNLVEVNNVIQQACKRLIDKDDSLREAFAQYAVQAFKVMEKHPGNQVGKLSESSMLYENADKIWDDFAQMHRQEGRQEGLQEGLQKGDFKKTYEIMLRAYKNMYPTESIQERKARLDHMTPEQLSKSLDQIMEKIFSLEAVD